MRLLPRSLIGQMALLIGAALLVAQLVNFALVLNERQKLSLAQNQGPAITRYASLAGDYVRAPAEFRALVLEDNSRRGARFETASQSHVAAGDERQPRIENRLADLLADSGVRPLEVRASFSNERLAPRRAQARGDRQGRRPARTLLLSARLADGLWLNGRLSTPPPDPWLPTRLGLATLLLYVIVLGATLFIATRMTRPLRDLTRAAEQFGGRDAPREVEPRGPADLRRAIEAFNAMNRRLVVLIDEKDRMLGAIGHDLRTPLASLRIRAENVGPEAERERMVATIDEMAITLEDILVLARSGRAREQARQVDVAALVDSIVEEYRERGEAVDFEPAARSVTAVQPNLLRRAVRNLIDNALKYGVAARVRVEAGARGEPGSLVRIEVADDGPGLPPDQLRQVLEPFYRGEGSRSRETGGAGLGLAIARAIAESHGGGLELRNGAEKGLVAALHLPVDAAG